MSNFFDEPKPVRSMPERSWDAPWVDDNAILRHWRNGLDTYAIAQKYFVHEAAIANRLPRILLADRMAF